MSAIIDSSRFELPSFSSGEDFSMKSYVSVDQLTDDGLGALIKRACDYKFPRGSTKPNYKNTLQNTYLALVFHESSTRTRVSFEIAAKRLGADTVVVDNPKTSSFAKGESWRDTVRTLVQYTDGMVIRTSEAGAPAEFAELATKWKGRPYPIINAGDGSNEHPTQAIGDVLTIRENLGKLNGLGIRFIGDLKYGRTVHSLYQLLRRYKGNRFTFVAPEGLELPKELERSSFSDSYFRGFVADQINPADIWYVTRIQKERLPDPGLYNTARADLKLTLEVLEKYGNSRMMIMHPLPKLDEDFDPAIDNDPRAWYFRQAENGLYARMALLSLIFGR